MASIATVTFPPEYRAISHLRSNKLTMLQGKSGVLFISVIEMMGSITVMLVYLYAIAIEPEWFPSLVPIPLDICSNPDKVVNGIMSTVTLLSGLELLLGLHLFEGARQEKLGRIRFWMSAMLMYVALVTLVILGMGLGKIRNATVNCIAFFNIFLRLLEILMVYEWSEQMRSLQRTRRAGHSHISRHNYNDIGQEETPPPSYSSTIPSASWIQKKGFLSPDRFDHVRPSYNYGTIRPEEGAHLLSSATNPSV